VISFTTQAKKSAIFQEPNTAEKARKTAPEATFLRRLKMKWRSLAVVAAAGVLTLGCDSLPFLGGGADDAAEPEAAVPATRARQPEPDPEPIAPVRTSTRQLGEEPWFPTDTGTVRPGMTSEEVVATWGPPVTDRAAGNWTFLYFRNGCEQACGTFDVVLLEGGQVVDAIVRGVGHTYAGISSSPPDRVGEFTAPASSTDTLRVIG